jgi:glycopeptide antibiotics resistance protein
MQEKKGLNNTTIVLMICVAIFFDVLQALLTFIFMGWVVGIFAFLTFYLWFKLRGLSFMKPKRLLTFGGASLIEIIPFLSALPAWTAAIIVLALDSKIKKVIPNSDIIKK